MSSRNELLRRMWELGYARGLEGKDASVTYDTRREAERTRLSLYTSVRKIRQNPSLDYDFADKLEHLECVIDQVDDKYVLRIRNIALNPGFQKAADQLGLLTEPDMDEADAIAKRLSNLSPAPSEDDPV